MPPAAAQPPTILTFAPILAIFAIFYFLIIRPQQKQAREHTKMLDNLANGDRVLTGGGIFGTVTSLRGPEVDVRIAERVVVTVVRSTISRVIVPTTAAAQSNGRQPSQAK
ncbi:MAG: preprotein translocase subunit YajC [Elusimicrobia bacterium]|nr:preprotein translocase subunit YajC [Elusimicrobiota bacterium]